MLEQLNLIVTAMLAGLIWTIQLVHYPSFAFVQRESFTDFSRFHTKRISMLVIPLMLAELTLAILLVFLSDWAPLLCLSLLLVIGIWAATFGLSVPCHNALGANKDGKVIQKLVRTNWLRTGLWTVKLGVLVFAVST
jgi:hypothetical protein